jgi:hypothetical protein
MEHRDTEPAQVTRKELFRGNLGILYDVQALRSYAEHLPIETRSMSEFKELGQESAKHWNDANGSSLGIFEIISD